MSSTPACPAWLGVPRPALHLHGKTVPKAPSDGLGVHCALHQCMGMGTGGQRVVPGMWHWGPPQPRMGNTAPALRISCLLAQMPSLDISPQSCAQWLCVPMGPPQPQWRAVGEWGAQGAHGAGWP